ncbi:MAG: class I SAM-dependent methyltransferase [Hyphomicrobiaceae bacterium]
MPSKPPPQSSQLPAQLQSLKLLTMSGVRDYALLDSGAGRKLERYGKFVFERPEPQALWQPRLSATQWEQADATFKSDQDEDGEGGRWRWSNPLPETWPLQVMDITMLCRLMSFRHLGIFPEQVPHWQWMVDHLKSVKAERPRVLNLFAYTGAASLIAARAGAEVTHVDASKKAIGWAKENQAASKLTDAPIRWILDDAKKFVAREVRRGRTYHMILVDPPKFGRGPDGEVWDFFTDIAPLLRDCAALLAAEQSALILTSYAIRASAVAIDGLLRETVSQRGGRIETGELAISEEGSTRLLPTSLYTRWSAGTGGKLS